MIDNNNINTATDSGDLTPITPPTVSNPPIPPLVPLGAWTWNTPVIPTFYWNVYSAEQRIRQICLELGRIGAWCDYAAATANANHMELSKRIDELAAKLTEEVTRLDQRIDEENKAREAADALLQEGLDKETARAKAAEQVLQQNLDSETANRESADETLNEKITDETNRASTEEQAIRTELAAETARAETQESVLQKNIDAEATNREKADRDLESTVQVNKNASDEADKRLQDSIDTEIANRKNGDNALGERIDTETTARTQADSNLETLISNETSNRTTADNLLTQQVNRRVKANNVTAEPNSHITVTSSVSDTEPDGTTVVIGDTFTPEFDKLESKLTEETTRATSAETELSGRISHETSDRENADATLTQAVNARLKATGIIAGDNITVTPDPDSTTVTISAPNAGGLTTVAHDHSLSGDGTNDTPLTVNQTFVAYQTDVNTEANRAKSAEADLQTAIDKKLSRSDLHAGSNVSIQIVGDSQTINADTGLKTVSVRAGQLTGTGTSSNPLGINSAYAVNAYVDTKITPQQILAGDGINITRSEVGSQTPSVTISATGGGGGLTEVEVDSPLEGDGTSSNPIGFSESELNSYLQNLDVIRDLQTEDTSLDSRLSSVESTLPTKIAEVRHDDTLTGSGTSDSNLKVNLNHSTVMSDTGNTVYPTLMHAAGDANTINGIGFNAGDGLTAYNSSDEDTGSGIRLSSDTLLTLEEVAPYGAIMIFDWIKFVGATSAGTYQRYFLSSAVCKNTLENMQTQTGQPIGAIYANASGAAMNPANFSQIVLHSPLKPSAQYNPLESNMNLHFESSANTTGAYWVLAGSPTFDFSDGTTITFQNSGSTSVAVGHYFVSIQLQV